MSGFRDNLLSTSVLSVPAGAGTNPKNRGGKQIEKVAKDKFVIQPMSDSDRGESPFCACGCGQRVTWNKQRKQWNLCIQSHNVNKTVCVPDYREAPLCKCGCGEIVDWDKLNRRWYSYVRGHRGSKIRPPAGMKPPLCGCGCGQTVKWNTKLGNWSKFLSGHNAKTPEFSKAHSKRMRANWCDLSFRSKVIARSKQGLRDWWEAHPEERVKMSIRMKEVYDANPELKDVLAECSRAWWRLHPEAKLKQSKMLKDWWRDDEFRRRQILAIRAHQGTDERREFYSKKMKENWASDKYRETVGRKISQSLTKLRKDKTFESKRVAGLRSVSFRSFRGRLTKEAWQDDAFVEKVLAGWNRRPNTPEHLFDMLTPANVRYTGDGSWWRRLPNGKCKNPDFKVTGENKVIEIFGDYWHNPAEAYDLIQMFWRVGIECLIVWEHEIKRNIAQVLDKVASFIDQEHWQMELSLL